MTKLVDILAKELKTWPDDVKYIVQDQDGELCVNLVGVKPWFDSEEWCDARNGLLINIEVAEDYDLAIITKEMWEEARMKLEEGKVKEDTYPWNGEGVPPVGTVCECSGTGESGEWGICTIKYAFGNVVVWQWDWQEVGHECVSYVHQVNFRPIQTAEQIQAELAAKEREDGINAMAKILCVVACDDYIAATALYDAGYRKVEDV
jgi:hypothetical protein